MEETTQNPKTKVITGEIKWNLEVNENDYLFTFNDSPENTLAGIEIARRMFEHVKQNLKDSAKNLHGRDKRVNGDRTNRMGFGSHAAQILFESLLRDLLLLDLEQKQTELTAEIKVVETVVEEVNPTLIK